MSNSLRPPWTRHTNSRNLLKLICIKSVTPSNHLTLWCPLLLPPSIFPSISLFQGVSSLHQVAKVSDLQLQHPMNIGFSPSNEYSGLISCRMDWIDLLAIQGILKSLLHHHSSKASILQHSDFFIVELSHSYMTTGKPIALTGQIFVGKVMSLLFNMLSMVITFLPRRKLVYYSARKREQHGWLSRALCQVIEPDTKESEIFSLYDILHDLAWEADHTGFLDLKWGRADYKSIWTRCLSSEPLHAFIRTLISIPLKRWILLYLNYTLIFKRI